MNEVSIEFNRKCQKFCKCPQAVADMEGLVMQYPYFQIARLMSVFGQTQSEALPELAFLTGDRTFLYRFLNGKVRPEVMEELSPIEAATAAIPKEISASEDGRTALEVLNDMLTRFKNEQNRPSDSSEVSEDEVYEDMGKSSNMERMNFVSETLAKLYVEQKEYDRAIKVYKSLMEKHPEKREAFALAMEEVKALKNA